MNRSENDQKKSEIDKVRSGKLYLASLREIKLNPLSTVRVIRLETRSSPK